MIHFMPEKVGPTKGWTLESGCRREQARSSVLEASTVAAAASRWRKQAVTALQDAEEVGAAKHFHTQGACLLAALTRWALAAGQVTHQACLPAPALKLKLSWLVAEAAHWCYKRSTCPCRTYAVSAPLELHAQHLPSWNCTLPAHQHLRSFASQPGHMQGVLLGAW